MQRKLLALLTLSAVAPFALAAPPPFRTDTCPVKLDGIRIGTDLTPGGTSLRNTIAFESATRLYHFWGIVADDPSYPSAASALGAVTHATSTDGIHFSSDRRLTYGIGSANFTTFGATFDPPLRYFRAVYGASSTWKLFAWTAGLGASVGDYNYNTSVDDLGSIASNTSVVHQGPFTTLTNGGAGGDEVGAFGLIGAKVYQLVDSLYVDGTGGGLAPMSYTDSIPPTVPWPMLEATEINLYDGSPYCWEASSACGTMTPPFPAFIHNAGRILTQTDGTLGVYYTFRKPDGSRFDKQIWYVESGDNGTTWSRAQGVFANGNAITIDGQPLDSVPGTANFRDVDVVQATNICRVYFSTQDAAGSTVFVSASTGSACDALFADSFEGCGG
jgi:hypothetical protein